MLDEYVDCVCIVGKIGKTGIEKIIDTFPLVNLFPNSIELN